MKAIEKKNLIDEKNGRDTYGCTYKSYQILIEASMICWYEREKLHN